MTLSERLLPRRIDLFPRIGLRRTPDANIPLAARPELQPGKKGYLIIAAPIDPLNPESTAFLDSIPEGLLVKRLDINPSEPRSTDYVIYNPSVAQVVTERFSISDKLPRKGAVGDANTRADILRRAGYKDTIQREYPHGIILIATRRPATLSSPADRTSR